MTGVARDRAATAIAAPDRGPLHGVRVVDLTMAWAGPLSTRVLAQLGADVIKIESAGKMDRWRGGTMVQRGTERYPAHDPGERPWNRNAYFNTQNVGKRSLALNLKSEAGHAIALELIRSADVVTENFAFGAMQRLGLDYPSLREHVPDLVMISMPGFGSAGPECGYIAHGPTIEQLAGNAYLQGYEGGPPLASGRLAWGDPVAGMTAAALLLLALWRRRATGEGGHIDLAHIEAGVHFNFDSIIEAVNGGATPERRGAGHATLSPHGVYRCRGEDRWLALACRDDRDREALRVELGAEVSDDAISAWAAELDVHEAVRRLVARGLPASAVLNAADLLADPQLASRGYFLELEHPEAGRHRYPGLPWQYGTAPAWWRDVSPAPGLGEHNEEILRELGRTPDQIAQLEAAGVIGAVPVRQGD